MSTIDTPAAAKRGEHLVDALAALRIDADGGLVEQHERRLVQQAAGDVQPALHAAGESFRRLAGAVLEIGPLERPVHARVEIGRRVTP